MCHLNKNLKFLILTEKPKPKKMHDFCFTIPYGLLVLFGGIFAFFRKGSLASLGGGVASGSLLIIAGALSLKAFKIRKNSYLAFILETGLVSFQFWKNCCLWFHFSCYKLLVKFFEFCVNLFYLSLSWDSLAGDLVFFFSVLWIFGSGKRWQFHLVLTNLYLKIDQIGVYLTLISDTTLRFKLCFVLFCVVSRYCWC